MVLERIEDNEGNRKSQTALSDMKFTGTDAPRFVEVLLFSAAFNDIVKKFVSRVVKKDYNQLFCEERTVLTGSDAIQVECFLREDIVLWTRKKIGTPVIRINSWRGEEFLKKYHTFVIGLFDKFEFVEVNKAELAKVLFPDLKHSNIFLGIVKSEPKRYTAYDGTFSVDKILEFLDYNKFPLVTRLTEMNSMRVYPSSVKLHVYVFLDTDDFKSLLEPLQDVARTFKSKTKQSEKKADKLLECGLMWNWRKMSPAQMVKPHTTKNSHFATPLPDKLLEHWEYMYGSCPKPAAGIVPSLEVITEGIAKRTRKPAIPKPVQSKGKPTEQPGDGNAVLGDETVHLGIEIDAVEKTHVAPGTYLSNTDPPGTKLNAKSTENRKKNGPVTTLDEPSSLFASEPQALIIEPKESTKWDDKMLSQPVCCQNSITKDITEHSKGKETLKSDDSPGTTSLADESNCILLKSNEGNTREHPSSMSKPAGTIINQARKQKPCYGLMGRLRKS
ncbi:hypothetical protein K1719_028527 [Acacia pycnantha]|nr:hypothetical protein K1719_028527 [Acacia pycnantha]